MPGRSFPVLVPLIPPSESLGPWTLFFWRNPFFFSFSCHVRTPGFSFYSITSVSGWDSPLLFASILWTSNLETSCPLLSYVPEHLWISTSTFIFLVRSVRDHFPFFLFCVNLRKAFPVLAHRCPQASPSHPLPCIFPSSVRASASWSVPFPLLIRDSSTVPSRGRHPPPSLVPL